MNRRMDELKARVKSSEKALRKMGQRADRAEERIAVLEYRLERALEGAGRGARGDKGYFAQFVNNCLQSYKGHTTVWGVLAASGGSTCSGVS